MLLALGARPRRIVGLVVTEALVLGLVVASASARSAASALVDAGSGDTGLDLSRLASGGGGAEVELLGMKMLDGDVPAPRPATGSGAGRWRCSSPRWWRRSGRRCGRRGSSRPRRCAHDRLDLCGLAVRNLGRNMRRTVLSVLGVGIGCAVALVFTGFRESVTEVYSRLAAESGPGDLRVGPGGGSRCASDKLRLDDGEAVLARVRAAAAAWWSPRPGCACRGCWRWAPRWPGVELVGRRPGGRAAGLRLVRQGGEGPLPDAGRRRRGGARRQALAERLTVPRWTTTWW